MNIENFETYLRQGNMAENTIAAYLYAVKEYYSRHKELNKRNLLVYKTYLIEKFKPKTVNLRIQAMNKYLDSMGKSRLRLKSVKVQQRSYLENVISNADYAFLKNKLKKEENQEWYFVVRFLAATGARVSELIQMKAEHVQMGYFDIYTKGGKIRQIWSNRWDRAGREDQDMADGHTLLELLWRLVWRSHQVPPDPHRANS